MTPLERKEIIELVKDLDRIRRKITEILKRQEAENE